MSFEQMTTFLQSAIHDGYIVMGLLWMAVLSITFAGWLKKRWSRRAFSSRKRG